MGGPGAVTAARQAEQAGAGGRSRACRAEVLGVAAPRAPRGLGPSATSARLEDTPDSDFTVPRRGLFFPETHKFCGKTETFDKPVNVSYLIQLISEFFPINLSHF